MPRFARESPMSRASGTERASKGQQHETRCDDDHRAVLVVRPPTIRDHGGDLAACRSKAGDTDGQVQATSTLTMVPGRPRVSHSCRGGPHRRHPRASCRARPLGQLTAGSARHRRTDIELRAERVRDVRDPPVDHVVGLGRGPTRVDRSPRRRIGVVHLEQGPPTGLRGLWVTGDAADLVAIRSAQEREVELGHVRVGIQRVAEDRDVEVARGPGFRGTRSLRSRALAR